MSNLNRITLIGNVGTDPEYVAFESGAMLTKLTLAVSRWDKKKNEDVTDWFDVETFSKLGDYVKKGHKLCVDGRIITNVWENKDGKKVKSFIVQANTIEILTKKENDNQEVRNEPKEQEPENYEQDMQGDDFIGEDEIPF